MQTRLQKREATKDSVLSSTDLLCIILPFVEGCADTNRTVFETIPLVSKTWNQVWKEVCTVTKMRHFARHCSLLEYEWKTRATDDFYARWREALFPLRGRAISLLRCSRGGIPSLLGVTVVEMAFDFNSPDGKERVPPGLWEYIARLRIWVSQVVAQNRSQYPSLPWFVPRSNMDPLHNAAEIKAAEKVA